MSDNVVSGPVFIPSTTARRPTMSDYVEYDDYQHRSDIEQHDEQDPGMIFIPQGSVYAELHAERVLADELAEVLDSALNDGLDRLWAALVLDRWREARNG